MEWLKTKAGPSSSLKNKRKETHTLVKVGEKEKISLQVRDLEILRFCLEMKFADIESLNFWFFDFKNLGLFAARKRIQKLEAGGFLKSTSMLSGTTKKFYLTTPKGYREILKGSCPTLQELSSPSAERYLGFSLPKPVTKLSVATFEHDLGVLKIRRLLEEQKRATQWRSERLLKAQALMTTSNLKRDFMPDALFTSKQGKIVAFEFENKPKTEAQLREKIFRLNAITERKDAPFEACLFVASTDNLKKKILSITNLIPGRFVVQSVDEVRAASLKLKEASSEIEGSINESKQETS